MRVVHITNDVAAASGVGTFVRRIDAELNRLGVDSSIATKIEDLSRRAADRDDPPYPLVVHIHGIWLGLHHAAAKWAKAHGAKLVWSTHGMTAPWSMRHKRWKKLPAWWFYQRADLRAADLVHATSENEVKWNARFGLKRQCVVPLGTDLSALSSTSTSPSTKTLLFVGRVYPVKALDRLIEAFALASSRDAADRDDPPYRWKLRIVGPDEGGHLAELKSLARSLGAADRDDPPYRTGDAADRDDPPYRVEFAGAKYGAELEAEYANCDCLALVSHTENFGATVVDAMAHGKPVITSTCTPWSIVRGGNFDHSTLNLQPQPDASGWWVENEPEVLAKAIGEMMAMSDEARAAMGANGRRLVEERFTWPSVGRAMLAEYEKLF